MGLAERFRMQMRMTRTLVPDRARRRRSVLPPREGDGHLSPVEAAVDARPLEGLHDSALENRRRRSVLASRSALRSAGGESVVSKSSLSTVGSRVKLLREAVERAGGDLVRRVRRRRKDGRDSHRALLAEAAADGAESEKSGGKSLSAVLLERLERPPLRALTKDGSIRARTYEVMAKGSTELTAEERLRRKNRAREARRKQAGRPAAKPIGELDGVIPARPLRKRPPTAEEDAARSRVDDASLLPKDLAASVASMKRPRSPSVTALESRTALEDMVMKGRRSSVISSIREATPEGDTALGASAERRLRALRSRGGKYAKLTETDNALFNAATEHRRLEKKKRNRIHERRHEKRERKRAARRAERRAARLRKQMEEDQQVVRYRRMLAKAGLSTHHADWAPWHRRETVKLGRFSTTIYDALSRTADEVVTEEMLREKQKELDAQEFIRLKKLAEFQRKRDGELKPRDHIVIALRAGLVKPPPRRPFRRSAFADGGPPPGSDGAEDYFHYVGQWKDGAMNGRGTYQFADGGTYYGAWKNGYPEGRGTAVYPDGTVFDGFWKAGQFHGSGKLTMGNGIVYEGAFFEGARSGEGVQTFPTGQVYRGHFMHNLRDGRGECTLPTGHVYNGGWRQGMIAGPGALHMPDGRKVLRRWPEWTMLQAIEYVEDEKADAERERKAHEHELFRVLKKARMREYLDAVRDELEDIHVAEEIERREEELRLKEEEMQYQREKMRERMKGIIAKELHTDGAEDVSLADL
eukprot:PLAT13745.1.p1 GENE.PLAT13745.1~~PLAT13745.1.p1  ORF type:complete len:756 (+),score=219.77 PLAT13745.1:50-2317(+)